MNGQDGTQSDYLLTLSLGVVVPANGRTFGVDCSLLSFGILLRCGQLLRYLIPFFVHVHTVNVVACIIPAHCLTLVLFRVTTVVGDTSRVFFLILGAGV